MYNFRDLRFSKEYFQRIPLEVNVTWQERETTLESFSNGHLLSQQEEEEEEEKEEEEENSRKRKKFDRFSRETIMVIMRGG